MLCAPVSAPRGELMAVISAMNKHNGNPFNFEDEQMITAIAEQAGVAACDRNDGSVTMGTKVR